MKIAAIAGGTKDFATGLAILIVTAAVVYVGYKVYKTGAKIGAVVGDAVDAVKRGAAAVGGAVKGGADAIGAAAGAANAFAVQFNAGIVQPPPPPALPPALKKDKTPSAPAEIAPWWWGGGDVSINQARKEN